MFQWYLFYVLCIMIELIEPMWGQDLLLWMHQVMQHPFFFERLPVVADVFVFVYPVYLVVLYGWGMIENYKGWMLESFSLKESAVWIFIAAMGSTIFNMLVQVFLVKDRPDVMLDLLYQKREDLILYDYLPEASFPSDHATMSMAIAVATLLYGLRYKKKGYVYFSIFLFVISLIMGYARISIGIHWPTDVIGGYLVGIFLPLLLFKESIYWFIKRLISFFILCETRLLAFLGLYK